MKFEKRELLLIVGVLFVMIGTMSVLAPAYALIIAVLLYFAIRVFVGRRKRRGSDCGVTETRSVDNLSGNKARDDPEVGVRL